VRATLSDVAIGGEVAIKGRVLYLTSDGALLQRQLSGENLTFDPQRSLIDNISTDELTPGWVCYYYDETLARYCLVGLRGGIVQKEAIRDAGFEVVVSGASKGCGSSRETAPYSELASGIRVVIARSIEKIYGQNAQNIGLLLSTDFSLLERMKDKVRHTESAAHAQAELLADNVDDRFAAMEKEGEIDRLLAEIKSKRKAG